MLRKSLIVLATASIGLTACTASQFNSNNAVKSVNSRSEARALVPRGLTMDQVREKLGRPTGNRTMNNETTWVYSAGEIEMSAAAAFGLGALRNQTKSVIVTFNSSGRVSRVEYLASSI